MLKEERHILIAERLSRDSRIYVSELSEELGVSDDTLRRDLQEMEQQGKLTKVHGGAIAKSGISLHFTERLNTQKQIKQRIAEKTVGLFNDGDVIIIDGGTTNLEIARQLPDNKRFTIFTNSLPIGVALAERQNIDLNILGGFVWGLSQVTIGLQTCQMVENVYADWSVIGVSDLHSEKGMMTDYHEEAITKRYMLLHGAKRITTATAEKLGTMRSYHIASLGEIDYIITEDDRVEWIKEKWGVKNVL